MCLGVISHIYSVTVFIFSALVEPSVSLNLNHFSWIFSIYNQCNIDPFHTDYIPLNYIMSIIPGVDNPEEEMKAEARIPVSWGWLGISEGTRDSMGTVSGSPPNRYMLCEEAAPLRSTTHTLLWETEMAQDSGCYITKTRLQWPKNSIFTSQNTGVAGIPLSRSVS